MSFAQWLRGDPYAPWMLYELRYWFALGFSRDEAVAAVRVDHGWAPCTSTTNSIRTLQPGYGT